MSHECESRPDELEYLGQAGEEELASVINHNGKFYVDIGPYCFPVEFCPFCGLSLNGKKPARKKKK